MRTFIQWKSTDVCIDLYCDCGHHNYYNGYFAYFVKCKGCEKVFKLADYVEVTEVNDTDADIVLESEI